LLHGLSSSGDAPRERRLEPPLGHGIRRRRRSIRPLNHGVRRGGVREGRCPPLPRYRPRRAASAPGSAAAIELSGSFRHRGPQRPGSQGFDFVGTMFIVRPTLTNSTHIPIFLCGMTSNRRVRPDVTPILERTGHPLPTRLFRRPPARVPLGSAPRRRAAYRSSGLDDQTHVDRCHTRGRNPRRGAGW
jgi:hypothetical protein